MTQEFLLYEDPERGVKTVGWFEPDGQMTVQVRQYIPDSFFQELERQRMLAESKKHGTQEHWRLVGMIPTALADNLLVDSDGNRLQMGNPDRDKKLKRILNDNEFRNLRVEGGQI